jgi:hypothetical protein
MNQISSTMPLCGSSTSAWAPAATDPAAPRGADAAAHRYVPPATPPATEVIRRLLVDGSYGPTTLAGATPLLSIPDGPGFGGVTGAPQDEATRAHNSYSVVDPNFFAALGALQDPATGQPFSFTSQVQAYNAAGYVSVFHPDLYERMVAVQDAGQGTILGMSLGLLGVPGAPTDPGLAAAGLATGLLANEQVPGSPTGARDVVMSPVDRSGAPWTQPHHAESSWRIYARLIESGVDWQEAASLSGDAAVSGAGRLNGMAEQADTSSGLTPAEAAVFQRGAELEARTGVPALFIMGGAHNHAGIDPNARTQPRVNELLGLPPTDRSASAERLSRIRSALLDGRIATASGAGAVAGGGEAGPIETVAVVLQRLTVVLGELVALLERGLAAGGMATGGGAATQVAEPVAMPRIAPSAAPPMTATKTS